MGNSTACPSALPVALLLALISLLHVAAVLGDQPSVTCPVQYSQHSLDDIRSRAKLPYLLGGIYDDSRKCSNCKRGGLWADFCGFKALGKSRYYDMQLCNSDTVDAVIDGALKQDYAADMLTMSPCDLWPYLRGRTTWVIGDSMSKDLFKALRCFMIEFQDLHTYHATNNATAMHFLEAIPGKGEPRCVHMLDNARLCQIHAIEGDLFVAAEPGSDRTAVGGVLPLIQQHLAFPHDLFIVHFGLWHGETQQEAYKKYLHQLGQYYESSKATFPNMFFMETPKQHFDSEDGDYKVPWITTRKGPWTCQPIKGVSLNPDGSLAAEPGNEVAQYVAEGSWRNAHAREVLNQYGLPLIHIYNETATAWAFHRQNLDGQECSHFCHPSLPQFWLWHLRNSFKDHKLTPVEEPWKQVPKAGCAIIYEWEETKFGSPKTAAAEEAEKKANATASFWEWIRGRSGSSGGGKIQVKDGVLHPPQSASQAAAGVTLEEAGVKGGVGGGKKGTARGGVGPWEVLQKLLDLRLLRPPQQDKSSSGSSKDEAGTRDGQRQQQLKQDAAAAAKQGVGAKQQTPQQQQQQEGSPAKVSAVKLERGPRRQQVPLAGQQRGGSSVREGGVRGPQAPGHHHAAGHAEGAVIRHRRKKQQQLSGGPVKAGIQAGAGQQQQQAGD